MNFNSKLTHNIAMIFLSHIIEETNVVGHFSAPCIRMKTIRNNLV